MNLNSLSAAIACRLTVAILPILAGCGSSVEDIRSSVRGKVTLDGQPVADGSIMFVPQPNPAAKTGPVAGGSIRNGQYSLSPEQGPALGKNKVLINAAKKTGKTVKSVESGKETEETVELVPEKYNSKTELEVEIKKGANAHDFDLKLNP